MYLDSEGGTWGWYRCACAMYARKNWQVSHTSGKRASDSLQAWHSGAIAQAPHEMVLDLTRRKRLRAFESLGRYLGVEYLIHVHRRRAAMSTKCQLLKTSIRLPRQI